MPMKKLAHADKQLVSFILLVVKVEHCHGRVASAELGLLVLSLTGMTVAMHRSQSKQGALRVKSCSTAFTIAHIATSEIYLNAHGILALLCILDWAFFPLLGKSSHDSTECALSRTGLRLNLQHGIPIARELGPSPSSKRRSMKSAIVFTRSFLNGDSLPANNVFFYLHLPTPLAKRKGHVLHNSDSFCPRLSASVSRLLYTKRTRAPHE